MPPDRPTEISTPAVGPDSALAGIASGFTRWAERWYPDAFVFTALTIAVVAIGAVLNGASPAAVSQSFGSGFWTLIIFAMQLSFVAITGYVIASSPAATRAIAALARLPRTGRGAVAFVAFVCMALSLFNWGIGMIFSGLLARALARRTELRMDYRAAGAAAYLGISSIWALGLSSAPAQLQANVASLPPSLVAITGIIPFSQTIFLWQSMLMAAVLLVVSTAIAYWSAPHGARAVTSDDLGVDTTLAAPPAARGTTPGARLENSPVVTLILAALGLGWAVQEFAGKDPIQAISNLNTYNLLFLILGLLLHWRPASFLQAVTRAVPAVSGVLIQFPLYGAIAGMMTVAKAADGSTLADRLAHGFVSLSSTSSFPVLMGIYSSVLGFFLPSGGGKWIIEAPYVMTAANTLHVHLGWAVTVYNAAEALPNLINPFWMLPLLGLLALKAHQIVGFTMVQLLVHLPLVLFMLWALSGTLTYLPPMRP